MGQFAISQTDIGAVEQRYQDRWLLVKHLRVFNSENGQLIGHISDLTTEGVRVICENPLPEDAEFQLTMEIPGENNDNITISMTARSIWNKPDVNPHFYDTGMQLIDPSDQTIAAITLLIDKLKSCYPEEDIEPEVDQT